jgi:hypothetical protein
VERPAETFEQERAAHGVLSQQSRASLAIGESEDRDLVLRRVTATGHDELQHGRRAVVAGRFGDERLRRVVINVADRDAPLLLEACDEERQIVEPGTGADANRLPANNVGD